MGRVWVCIGGTEPRAAVGGREPDAVVGDRGRRPEITYIHTYLPGM